MEAIIIHKRSFVDAFRQAEIDMNHAVRDAVKKSREPNSHGDVDILDGVQKSLAKLKERLIES